jgi:hypothetical protein
MATRAGGGGGFASAQRQRLRRVIPVVAGRSAPVKARFQTLASNKSIL